MTWFGFIRNSTNMGLLMICQLRSTLFESGVSNQLIRNVRSARGGNQMLISRSVKYVSVMSTSMNLPLWVK